MRWINIHSLSWSSSDRVLWAHVWMSNKYLKIVGGGWVSADGGNWGCDLNRRVCDQITSAQLAKIHPFDTSNIETINLFRRNAVEQLMIHPFKFLENRSYYYFKSLFLGIDLQAQWLAPRNILAISSLLILLVCLARLVIQLPKSDPIKVVAFSLLFGPLASTLLAHFETRYVWTLFITATFVPLFVSLEKTEQKRVENSET